MGFPARQTFVVMRPHQAGSDSAEAGRAPRPGRWWSSLLGDWLDEPTEPLPQVERPAVPGAAERGRGGSL
jgi:hypothetical protein